MKISTLILASALSLLSLPLRAADTFEFDPAHSTIGFKIRHLFSNVTGRFNDFEGKVSFDEAKPEAAEVNVTIKAASIDTANEKRDGHLKAEDFFDVAKFPELTFKSKKVERSGDKSAKVTGDLTMHGVTKEVVLTVEFLGKGKGMGGGTVTGWSGSAVLNRKDFGLDWNKAVEGSNILGDEVTVEFQVEADSK